MCPLRERPSKSNSVDRARRLLVIPAYAKVNLHLDVGPRRKDGYHDLRTLFQQISLHDTLALSLADGPTTLAVEPAGLPTGPDNLVVRALESLRTELRTKKGFAAKLTKRVPVGAGLGGGSADAAAALLGGWALLKGRGRMPSPKRLPPILPKLARKLGADVPFFLQGGTAWGEGIGEKLTPVPGCPKRWMVLVYPRVHVATAAAYRLLDQSRARLKVRAASFDVTHFRPGNSFEPVILPNYPAVAAARKALASAGCAGVLMSGSGSSVFGFVPTRKDGDRVARRLKARRWDVFVVHTV